MKKWLFGIMLAAIATSAAAQGTNDTKRANLGLLGTAVAPVAVGAAVGTGTSTFMWTTTATQTWNFPWHYKPIFGGNYLPQTANAVGQHVSNVFNPTYFNESINLTHPNSIFKPDAGTHTVQADYKQKHSATRSNKSSMGKAIVGCIFGSALGAITASVRKASAMGNPPRWRSQAEHERIVASGVEKKYELTSVEAHTAVALCGAGSLTLHWPQGAI